MSRGRSFLSSRFSRSLKSLTSLKSCLEEEVAALEAAPAVARDEPQENGWGNLLPELLGEIIKRVEESEDQWPQRQNVVACACVCKKWRHITKDIVVNSPLLTHSNASATNNRVKITFPACLKQPGPREFPHQCLIKRNKETSTFYLYMALSSSFTEMGKFLLAARRYRRGAHMEYLISLDADDISQGSNAYVGKLSSDFLGTNFTIYDSQSPHSGAKPSSTRSSRRFASKQISPQVSADNFEVGHVSYKFNLLKSRGPRRMVCAMKYPVSQDLSNCKDVDEPSKVPESATPICSVLRNKTPRWHENLQCWCLNFHGRVTVASVKNFQLVATVDQSQPEGKGDEDTVLLQFGKVAEDTFTMDYRQPLSVFQAFAICLTSFGTKLACE